MRVELLNGQRVEATYVRHLRTLTGAGHQSNTDLDLFRLVDGREIICSSPANDGRAVPVEAKMTVDEAMYLS